jgi:hypothetical protein
MKKILSLVLTLALAASANATLIEESFTGSFDNDNSRYYIDFDVTLDATSVDFTSWGYAGGVNAAGETIVDGGFDSQLFIFDSSNNLLASNDDASNIESILSGNSWDAFISIMLNQGSYTAVLTQYNSDYVSGDLFSGVWTDASVTDFMDVSDSQRTSAFAFDISGDSLENVDGNGVDTTPNPIPEPTTIALFGLALAGFAARRKNN